MHSIELLVYTYKSMYYESVRFEWDENKNRTNIAKHHIDFRDATEVFNDSGALHAPDEKHSTKTEMRYHAIGKIGENVATVTYTIRDDTIRIISAGYYRKERSIYEKHQQQQ